MFGREKPLGRKYDSGGYKIHHRRFSETIGRYNVIAVAGVVVVVVVELSTPIFIFPPVARFLHLLVDSLISS